MAIAEVEEVELIQTCQELNTTMGEEVVASQESKKLQLWIQALEAPLSELRREALSELRQALADEQDRERLAAWKGEMLQKRVTLLEKARMVPRLTSAQAVEAVLRRYWREVPGLGLRPIRAGEVPRE